MGDPGGRRVGGPLATASAKEWLRFAIDQGWEESADPTVFISFSSHDYAWVTELETWCDPELATVTCPVTGRPHKTYHFTDFENGTTGGEEYTRELARRMWQCRGALLVLSKRYVKSGICYGIEAPFLAWRHRVHEIPMYVLHAGFFPPSKSIIKIPDLAEKLPDLDLGDLPSDRHPGFNAHLQNPTEGKFIEQLPSDLERGKRLQKLAEAISKEIAAWRPRNEVRPPGADGSRPSPAVSRRQAHSNVPTLTARRLFGQEALLTRIERAFEEERAQGSAADQCSVVALHGLPGAGKTTLATTYATQRRFDYLATWWVRCESELTLRSDIVTLGIKLNWLLDEARGYEEKGYGIVSDRFAEVSDRILLIFDNMSGANVFKRHRPRGAHIDVLVTSNSRTWREVAEPIAVDLWPRSVGGDYLIERTGRYGERSDAEALSEILGGLPLAHAQAAAFCEDADVGFADYARRFEKAPADLMDDPESARSEYHEGRTVSRAFRLAIEQAAKRHPCAQPLIARLAMLFPEPAPLFLFEEGRMAFEPTLAEGFSGGGLDKAVAALLNLSLAAKEETTDKHDLNVKMTKIRLHRLVAKVAACLLTVEQRTLAWRELVAAAVAATPPTAKLGDGPEAWARMKQWEGPLRALVSEKNVDHDDENVAALLDRLAAYSNAALSDYNAALGFAERALRIRERTKGPNSAEVAANLIDEGEVYIHRREYDAAQRAAERALAIGSLRDPDPLGTAKALDVLAMVWRGRGDHVQARQLFERAHALREKAFGPDDPRTAESISNLAVALEDSGEIAAAAPLQRRALKIIEAHYGAQHWRIVPYLTNLGSLMVKLRNLDEARRLFERALDIRKKSLAPESLDTARSLNNLAFVLADHGEFAEALPLFEQALAIQEKAEDPDRATALSNLASLLGKMRRFEEAETLFRRSIRIAKATVGTKHENTQRYRTHYARLNLERGRPARALALARAALETLGPEHRWTQDAANVAADAFAKIGQADAAAILRTKREFGALC